MSAHIDNCYEDFNKFPSRPLKKSIISDTYETALHIPVDFVLLNDINILLTHHSWGSIPLDSHNNLLNQFLSLEHSGFIYIFLLL